ncbi:histidine ABC transporter permease HisM [Gilliamella sp. A7]|uniref:histidine ABC transporter permease HisM n=1 Tax=Gilliamella sp. A7 TaxID=1970465 RepID=UPI000A349C51|nr:histidine ABC transporter permease HisM [Gilliamella sp. A7]OTQ58219.1 amino acid ABC transporter permease [Gilliamella sp. A7]
MLEILQDYWKALLWSDGYHITGLAMTLWILILSVSLGGLFALVLAVGRNSKYFFIKWPIWLFTYVFRGTPLYVQLLIIYTGIYTLSFVNQHQSLNDFFQSGLNCTILAFALNTCAYTTEVFAGAIRNVPTGEIEAATALGFNRCQLYRYIILPRAFRIALPAYSNEVIFMLHSTALAFTVTVQDVMKIARDIYAETYQPFHAFGIAAVIYLCVSFVLIFGFRQLEKHYLFYMNVTNSKTC